VKKLLAGWGLRVRVGGPKLQDPRPARPPGPGLDLVLVLVLVQVQDEVHVRVEDTVQVHLQIEGKARRAGSE